MVRKLRLDLATVVLFSEGFLGSEVQVWLTNVLEDVWAQLGADTSNHEFLVLGLLLSLMMRINVRTPCLFLDHLFFGMVLAHWGRIRLAGEDLVAAVPGVRLEVAGEELLLLLK